MAKLKLKVIPGSAKSSLVGWLGDAYKIKISEAPEKGKANKAILKLLSEALNCPLANLNIVAGETSSNKLLEIKDLSESEVIDRLGS